MRQRFVSRPVLPRPSPGPAEDQRSRATADALATGVAPGTLKRARGPPMRTKGRVVSASLARLSDAALIVLHSLPHVSVAVGRARSGANTDNSTHTGESVFVAGVDVTADRR